MVEVSPFKGIIYNNEKIDNLENVVSPPYDIISEDMQNELYQKNPYNFVQLILGKIFPNDSVKSNDRCSWKDTVINDTFSFAHDVSPLQSRFFVELD